MLHHYETQLLELYHIAWEQDALLQRYFYRCNILYTIYAVSMIMRICYTKPFLFYFSLLKNTQRCMYTHVKTNINQI